MQIGRSRGDASECTAAAYARLAATLVLIRSENCFEECSHTRPLVAHTLTMRILPFLLAKKFSADKPGNQIFLRGNEPARPGHSPCKQALQAVCTRSNSENLELKTEISLEIQKN